MFLKCHSKTQGTLSLLNHLKRCGKYNRLKTKADKGQSFLSFEVSKSADDSEKNMRLAKYTEKKIRQALARMIVIDELPFLIVEDQGFKDFVRVIELRFPIPSRYIVMRDCIRVYYEEREKFRDLFVREDIRVCFTTNTWTSIQNLNYMCVTTHFIDSGWTLHKRILFP